MSKTKWVIWLTVAIVYALFAAQRCIHYDEALHRVAVRRTTSSFIIGNTSIFLLVIVIMARPKRDE